MEEPSFSFIKVSDPRCTEVNFFLQYNNCIKTDDAVTYFEKFLDKNINFLSQLLENGRIILWVNLKDEYEFKNDVFFKWAQPKYAISTICNFCKMKNTNF